MSLMNIDFYYFSPTGGTKKVGDIFCSSITDQVHTYDLGDRAVLRSWCGDGHFAGLCGTVFPFP